MRWAHSLRPVATAVSGYRNGRDAWELQPIANRPINRNQRNDWSCDPNLVLLAFYVCTIRMGEHLLEFICG